MMTQSAPETAPRSPEGPWESWGGLRWGIVASIVGPIAWLVFTLLFVGFWAQGYSLFQSIIVILVSLLILAGVLGTAWTVWGTRSRNWRRMSHWAAEGPGKPV